MAASPLDLATAALDAGDFARARALAEDAVREADTPRGKGHAKARSARTGSSRDVVHAAKLAGRADVSRAAARRVLALALLYNDRSDDAERMAIEAIRIARAAGSSREAALSEIALAEVHRSRGDYVAGMRHATRARRMVEKANDARTEAAVLSDYALLLSRLGDDERARETFDRLLAGPVDLLPRASALRVFYNTAMTHRAAGRFDAALRILDRADALPRPSPTPAVEWSLTSARLLTLIDMGAFEAARFVLDALDESRLRAGWQRAQLLNFRAVIAHGEGARSEIVEAFVQEGLAIEGIEPPTRAALERTRALSLVARGRLVEAERIAIMLTSSAARGGTRSQAAQGFALAARSGPPDAWLLRWLGAAICGGNGAAARLEHEAYAALVTEPDPIGQLARNGLATVRARLLDRTPLVYRKTLLKTLRQVEQRAASLRQSKRTEAELTVPDDVVRAMNDVGIAGESPALLRAVATVARASRSNASVVLTGETGSGKELFARLAHRVSPRAQAPFVAVNVAAIPHSILEAELFGHERGAFTGAERSRRGLFAEAEGGTLFLDEVGEMSAAMQVKLLRVLEDGEVRPVGGTRSRNVDVRVVAATHRDLAAMVMEGSFREDLFYRLAAITVRIPSLRERVEDLPSVARAILARDPATKDHRLDVPAFTLLAEHAWPGNVRELANVLRVAAALSAGTVIGREELVAALPSSALSRSARSGDPNARGDGSSGEGRKPALMETTLAALRERHRAEVRELVGRAIASADGNKREAARALGVSRQGLYRVLDG